MKRTVGGAAAALIVLIIIIVAATSGKKSSDTTDEERTIPVVVTLAVDRNFEERLVVQGNVEAKEFAMVSPRLQGTIETIFVDEGDSVIAGVTPLFQIDSVTLEKAVEIRKQDLAVSKCAKREKEANLERASADFEKAELDYKRYQRLFKDNAVSADIFEQQESRYKQSLAMKKYAQTLVDLSAEQVKQAQTALEIADKNLKDALVLAPINGEISRRLKEPGEMGEPGKPIVRIDSVKTVEISAYLPARYYAAVKSGNTLIRLEVSGIKVGDYKISYKSPTIDSVFRTFEIKCVLNNPPENVVPGTIAEIQVVFQSRQGLGVPSIAIQKRGGDSVVFVADNNSARMVVVKTGLESDGWTEILDGRIGRNTPIITMGQTLINNGSSIQIQQEGV